MFGPLYFFPRNCPRIAVCGTGGPYRLLIQADFEAIWRAGVLYRYEFDPLDGFVDCKDHGVWVSSQVVTPVGMVVLDDLPGLARERGISVEVVPSLTVAAREFFDFERGVFIHSDHVSMIRMGLLEDWPRAGGAPVLPPSA